MYEKYLYIFLQKKIKEKLKFFFEIYQKISSSFTESKTQIPKLFTRIFPLKNFNTYIFLNILNQKIEKFF